jgi:hypothetical protein
LNASSLPRRLPLLILAAAATFHLATIRDGHSWGDDFAHYLLHARNLVQGLPYRETGFLQNPVDPAAVHVGPEAYPPLAPVLLAPVYGRFGLSFPALKAFQVLVLIAALTAVYFYFRSGLLLALAAFHPLLWEAKEYIGSDLPLLALVYAALLLTDRLVSGDVRRLAPWLLLGCCLYAACAARVAGLTLFPVPLALAAIRRIPLRLPALATGTAAALLAAQNLVLNTDGVYFRILVSLVSPGAVWSNLLAYPREFLAVWSNGFSLAIAKALYVPSLLLAAWGLRARVGRSVTALELFLASYLAALLLWPSFQGVRLLLPVVPAFLHYLVTGAAAIRPSHARAGAGVVAALLFAGYASNYSLRNWAPAQSGMSDPEFAKLSDYVVAHTAPGDRFLFHKPRALTLKTARAAAIYNQTADDAATWELIRKIGVRYLVLADLPDADFRSSQTILRPFVARYPENFESVYGNRTFTLYRVR